MVLDREVVGVDISKMVLTGVMHMCYRAAARAGFILDTFCRRGEFVVCPRLMGPRGTKHVTITRGGTQLHTAQSNLVY